MRQRLSAVRCHILESAQVPIFFFFNDTATTEIYTLSLHDALPIYRCARRDRASARAAEAHARPPTRGLGRPPDARSANADRKSTRLNSSHLVISYAVFCLKKKKTVQTGLRLSIEITLLHLTSVSVT